MHTELEIYTILGSSAALLYQTHRQIVFCPNTVKDTVCYFLKNLRVFKKKGSFMRSLYASLQHYFE